MIFLLPVWIFFLSLLVGSFILRRVNFAFPLERVAFAFPLGYGLLAYLVYICGLFLILSKASLLLTFSLITLICLPEAYFWIRKGYSFKKINTELTGLNRILLLFIGLALLLTLMISLLPPTAHDALVYQLYIPKRFAQVGQVTYFPYLVNSLFPFLIQMHYTVALIFEVPEVSQVFHWMCGFGIVLGILSFCNRFYRPQIGYLAVLIFLLSPGIFHQMPLPLNDIAVSFFTFFALYAFYLGLVKNKVSWFVLAGIFSGYGLSIKYLAVLHILVLVFIAGLFVVRDKKRFVPLCKALAIYGAGIFLFSFSWYLRSYLIEGNPFYPFFPEWFTGIGHSYDLQKAGLGKGILDFLLLPWHLTMSPGFFGGTWTHLGVIYLLFLPLVLIFPKKQTSVRFLFVFVVLFIFIWFILAQNARFLFPILPMLSILIASASEKYKKYLLPVLILNFLFLGYFSKDAGLYFIKGESQETYLLRNERTYGLGKWASDNLKLTDKIFNLGDPRMFYFEIPMVRAEEFRKKTGYDVKANDPREVFEFLKGQSITHIFTRAGLPKGKSANDVRTLLAQEIIRDRYLKLIHTEEGKEWTYFLYEIK